MMRGLTKQMHPKKHLPIIISTFVISIFFGLPATFAADGTLVSGSSLSSAGAKVRRNQIRNFTNVGGPSPEVFMISADEGETVYISCPLNKTYVHGCEWYKKSPQGGNRKRITQFLDRYQRINSCQLQIRSVTYEDAGMIICKSITDSAEPTIHTSQLIVTGEDDPFGNTLQKPSSPENFKGLIPYSEPEIVKDLFSIDNHYKIHKGGTLVVKCEAHGNPKPLVSWRRGSKLDSPPTEGYSNLKISNLTDHDTGVYKCEAINLFGKSVKEINLQVIGALQGSAEILDVTPRNATLYEGSQGNITCIARFEGDAWFAWAKKIDNKTKANKTFSYEGHIYEVLPKTEIRPLRQQLYATTLLLQNVTTLSSGIYHCIVAGLQGYNHSEAYVTVEKDPIKLHMAQIGRHKKVAILWIFSFVIFAALVVLCIVRVYGCPNTRRGKLSSQGSSLSTQSSTKKTQLPKRSPETLSTDCTHHMTPHEEVFDPLVTPHGSCSLASQEPSVHFKDCNSSCGTYNSYSYDPEFSVINSSAMGGTDENPGDESDSFIIADLEAARSSYSRAGSFCDSEYCSRQSAASPRTQTSDYYTRRQFRRHHHRNSYRPYYQQHRHHQHLYQQGKGNFNESHCQYQSSHFLQFKTANLQNCTDCTSRRDYCSCNSCEPSNLSSFSSDCESVQWHSQQSDGMSLPNNSNVYHYQNSHDRHLHFREQTALYDDVGRSKLNPSPNLSFLEQLKANPNTITAIL